MVDARYRLFHGDCLDILPTLEAGSVDCVIVDPPYYNIVAHQWDRQWKTIEDYQVWIEAWAIELRRVLKTNGSLYVFGDDKAVAYVQVVLDRHFLLLNNLVWFKTNNMPIKAVNNLRSFAPMTERILFYSAQYDPTGWETVKLDTNNFLPLREYFRQYQEAMGVGLKKINERLGHRKAEHAFYWNSTQWDLPTAETYQELADAFPCDFERREYEDLRREYEDLRRTWNTDGNTLDVIVGSIITAKENTAHPTTKPLWIMKRLVECSTNEGDTVLDFTMGSGSCGVAAMNTGRRFVGVEINAGYYAIAQERIGNAAGDYRPTAKEEARGMKALFW